MKHTIEWDLMGFSMGNIASHGILAGMVACDGCFMAVTTSAILKHLTGSVVVDR